MKKGKKAVQLPLQLPLEVTSAREDLVVTSANREAVNYLDNWPRSTPDPGSRSGSSSIAILAGPVGAGKTHLANIWAARVGAKFLTPSTENGQEIPETGSFVVEDIAQGGFSETWLFHLINATLVSKGNLLLTSRCWPGDWGIALPDLQSRMKLAHLLELFEPDDILLTGVLTKLFSDRQLQIQPDVVEYLVRRMERSLSSAQILVSEIDQLSLSEKRGVSKHLAGAALKNLGLVE